MAEQYTSGVNRVVYKAEAFGTGKTVTAYFWNPSLTKSALQTFTELELGIYYLDYDFTVNGTHIGLFYEGGVAKTVGSFRVSASTNGGSGSVEHEYHVTDADEGTNIPDALVVCYSEQSCITAVASGRTNSLGKITFYLDASTTYYFTVEKFGYTFSGATRDNPDSETTATS